MLKYFSCECVFDGIQARNGKITGNLFFKGNNMENYWECVFKRNLCGKRENYRQHLHPVVFVCVPDEE